MNADALLLSRLQFAFTVTFHILFPSLSIGLVSFLVLLEGLWLRTQDDLYRRMYRFFLKIFAMSFGMGVVTGLVLSFEFGTNFSRFAQGAGSVVGSIIGLEVVSAFFLEAGFLGIMLFGWGRVSKRVHFAATICVAVGTMISAGWILSANSWMQTPAGYRVENGRFVVDSWAAVVLNPSFPVRYPHMLLAAWITGAFFVAGVSAYYLLKREHPEFARRSFSIALGAACLLLPTQVFLGDLVYGVMAEHQPSKVQAMEGFWQRTPDAPYLCLIGPDQAAQKNDWEVGVPYLGSILLTHSLHGAVEGLSETPRADQPNMGLVFYAFRLMFFTAIAMFACATVSLVLRARGTLATTRWFHIWCVAMLPSGFLATVGGWYTAEIGRQPYVVYGLLRTADAVSPVTREQVLVSFSLIATVYTVLLGAFLTFLWRVVRRGPEDGEARVDAEAHPRRHPWHQTAEAL